MSTTEAESETNEHLRQRYERDMREIIKESGERGYRAGYYSGFTAGFPAGYRESVRDKSVPFMRAGWDQVPNEVTDTGKVYCQVVMTLLHMAEEPGWSLFPLERFWEESSGDDRL